MSKKQKHQAINFLNQNPVESFGNLMQGVGSSLATDLAGAGASDFFGQLFGTEVAKEKPRKESGDLQEGQALELKKAKQEAAIEPGINYVREIIHADKASSHEDRAIKIRVEEILIEIKKLTDSSKELEIQFKDIAIETQVVNPGKYHENLFEWIFSVIKTARMRIQESAGWLTAMHSKKDRKYWAMFKKHGTTFGLSNERVVATQTG